MFILKYERGSVFHEIFELAARPGKWTTFITVSSTTVRNGFNIPPEKLSPSHKSSWYKKGMMTFGWRNRHTNALFVSFVKIKNRWLCSVKPPKHLSTSSKIQDYVALWCDVMHQTKCSIYPVILKAQIFFCSHTDLFDGLFEHVWTLWGDLQNCL